MGNLGSPEFRENKASLLALGSHNCYNLPGLDPLSVEVTRLSASEADCLKDFRGASRAQVESSATARSVYVPQFSANFKLKFPSERRTEFPDRDSLSVDLSSCDVYSMGSDDNSECKSLKFRSARLGSFRRSASKSLPKTHKTFSAWHKYASEAACNEQEDPIPGVTCLSHILSPGQGRGDHLRSFMCAIKGYEKRDWGMSEELFEDVTSEDLEYVRGISRSVNSVFGGEYPHLVYMLRGNQDYEVIAGTEGAVLDALIFPLSHSMEYQSMFFSTYKLFMTPMRVLNHLIELYNIRLDPSPDTELEKYKLCLFNIKHLIRRKVLACINLWVNESWEDFLDYKNKLGVYRTLISFLEYTKEVSGVGCYKILESIRNQKLFTFARLFMTFPLNEAVITPKAPCDEAYLVDLPDWAFAMHCFSITMSYIRYIPMSAYVSLLLTPYDPECEDVHPGVKTLLDYIKWTYNVGKCLENIILEAPQKECTKRLKKALSILGILRMYGDYSTLAAVLCALKSKKILSLTENWKGVRSSARKHILVTDWLFSPEDEYSNYWAEISSRKDAFIPCVVLHLSRAIRIIKQASDKIPRENFTHSSIDTMRDLLDWYSAGRPAGEYFSDMWRERRLTSNEAQSGPPTPLSPQGARESDVKCADNKCVESDVKCIDNKCVESDVKCIDNKCTGSKCAEKLTNIQKCADIYNIVRNIQLLSGSVSKQGEPRMPSVNYRYESISQEPFMKCVLLAADSAQNSAHK